MQKIQKYIKLYAKIYQLYQAISNILKNMSYFKSMVLPGATNSERIKKSHTFSKMFVFEILCKSMVFPVPPIPK